MRRRAAFAAAGLLAAVALAGCGGAGGAQEVRIEVSQAGYVPRRVEVPRGRPVAVTFERVTDKTCGTDVVFQSLHKGFDLPLNKPVRVELSAAEIGDSLNFNCSMDMLHGVLVAR